jgi:dienelactone hydrolase
VIQGYTGHLAMWRNRTPYRQPFPEAADAVFAAGDVPPALVIFVDACWACRHVWDPVRIVPRYAEALRSLRAVWLDAGTRDEWYVDVGTQAFRDQLRAVGLPDERVHFELFDAGHGGIDYRYPVALSWLCRQIAES